MSFKKYDDVPMRDLRILDALLRDRSLMRTARALGTTRPSLSKALARLRVQFADPLFVRNGQQMEPAARRSISRRSFVRHSMVPINESSPDLADTFGALLAGEEGV